MKEDDSVIRSCNVLVGVYSDDGTLINVKKERVVFSNNEVEASIVLSDCGAEMDKLKIMAWNDSNAPLMDAYAIE